MGFSFATCNRLHALDFLRKANKNMNITDTEDSAKQLLDFVEKDIVRIQDPMMHPNAQVIPSTNWNESYRKSVIKSASFLHKEEKNEKIQKKTSNY